MKDSYGRCVMEYLAGAGSGATGTDIPEYTIVAPDEVPVLVDWDGEKVEAAVFNDLLQVKDGTSGEVLAAYVTADYAGTPALIRNRYGKGEAYYFGGAFSPRRQQSFSYGSLAWQSPLGKS